MPVDCVGGVRHNVHCPIVCRVLTVRGYFIWLDTEAIMEILEPIHKNKVIAMLKNGQPFVGYIAPSNVNSYHIDKGFGIGMRVKFTSVEELEKTVRNFAYYNCNAELGHRVRFWTWRKS